eukprot:8828443-Karenia_brevis.AAC.1
MAPSPTISKIRLGKEFRARGPVLQAPPPRKNPKCLQTPVSAKGCCDSTLLRKIQARQCIPLAKCL